jgi:hypothetical protein
MIAILGALLITTAHGQSQPINKVTKALLSAISQLESNKQLDSVRINKNGTVDLGPFQINSVNWSKCVGLKLQSYQGGAACATRLLNKHLKRASHDPCWFASYHSKTPQKKIYYCKKINEILKNNVEVSLKGADEMI